jgi:dimethylargininase
LLIVDLKSALSNQQSKLSRHQRYDGRVLIALTREVSPALGACELTHLPRVPIDVDTARRQHRVYEEALTAAGCTVERLASGPDMADAVFVEDTAVVFDELAIITRPGAESRREEGVAVAEALRPYRMLRTIEAPGTIDGGDVLAVGRSVYIGRSSRTNDHAIAQVRRLLAPFGYTVCDVVVTGCLHLKSAVTALDNGVLLINPDWIPTAPFGDVELVHVHPEEPMAANALRAGDSVIYPAAFPRTAERLARRGFLLSCIDASELAKAEGAVTCCSVILRQ